jgi:RND family efflux transporter MFP subunit
MTLHADRPDRTQSPVGVDPDLGFHLPAAPGISKTAVAAIALGAAALLGIVFAFVYLQRHKEREVLEEAAQTADHAALRVEVITPKAGSSDRAVRLPASVQPLQETVVYARASGFVRRWLVDLGDRVAAGQLLAEIETPELDQELLQARAQLAQAQPALLRANADHELSVANLKRYEELAPAGVVAQTELDQHRAQAKADDASVSVARAAITAQEANIRRLSQLTAFSKVTAPFAGTITQRWVEIGALVTAGNGQPLYRVAATDPARVIVQVPQDVAPSVRPALAAKVIVREYPGRAFDGVVARSAGELDAATRTMTTEVRVPNADGALLPGMYAEIALTLPSPHRVYELPATALMTDATGPHVASVGSDGKIHLLPVVIERDTGTNIDVSSGLTGSEAVAKLGSSEFVEGRPAEAIH